MLISVGERDLRARSPRWRSTTSARRRSRSRVRRRGSSTSTRSTAARRIVDVRARRHPRGALDPGQDRPSVAGFQGFSSTDFDITTLGRGGSDTTAVALAAALGAEGLRDLHRRGGRLHGRPAARARGAQAARGSATRRCSSWRPPARRCSRYARSRSRATTPSSCTSVRRSRRRTAPGFARRTNGCSRRR